MENLVKRLDKVMSYTEKEAVKMVNKEIGGEDTKIVINSKLAEESGITRSTVNSALKLLEVTGIIETRSLGMKGTLIKVLNHEALDSIY